MTTTNQQNQLNQFVDNIVSLLTEQAAEALRCERGTGLAYAEQMLHEAMRFQSMQNKVDHFEGEDQLVLLNALDKLREWDRLHNSNREKVVPNSTEFLGVATSDGHTYEITPNGLVPR